MTSRFFAGTISKLLLTPLVVRSDAAIVGLPLNVLAKLLFEPRCGCGEGSDPVRLCRLRFGRQY
jgi:hypothetical protein